MNNEMKTVTKLFTAWQDDKEEEWLRSMAQQGWHLVLPRLMRYTFRRGEPQDVVYRLDYFNSWNKSEKQSYYDLFAEAGWEWLGELAGWQYFRKPARAGEPDEIYTDNASKIEKYRRLMLLFGPLLLMLGFNLINLGHLRAASDTGDLVIRGLVLFALLLLSYGTLRTYLRIRKLQGL